MSRLIVGYILANDTTVISFAVDPRYRNRGIGTALMRHFLFDVKQDVFLQVDVDNQEAQRLYCSLGFTFHKHLPQYYAELGRDALSLIRPMPEIRGDEPSHKFKISKIGRKLR